MTNVTIEKQVLEDGAIMEDYLSRDGEVPPVLFFHFPKINRKIANMMNKVPVGKLPVKNGFFLSLNDPLIMDNRHEFLHHMGTIIAAMELLEVLETPQSIVFCAEGWASSLDPKKTKKRPSEDPKATDVFITSGMTKDGETYIDVKEKRLKMVKVDGKKALKAELVPFGDKSSGEASAPILDAFFTSYHSTIEKMRKDKSYKQFEEMAKEDPVEAFRQGMEAAMTMTKMTALKNLI